MSNFGFILITSLCVHYTLGIKKSDIRPTMEPYNQTHCKIFYENSFDELPKEYQAKLIGIDEDRGSKWFKTIEDNLVKFPSCVPIKQVALAVEIDHEETTVASELFNYVPGNVGSTGSTIRYHGCLNSDGTLGGEEEMKKKNKFFELCLKRIKMANKTTANESFLTVRAIFSRKEAKVTIKTVTIERKDLESCGLSDVTIAVLTIIPVLVLLAAFAAYSFYKRNKDIEDAREVRDVNPTYGDTAYNDYDYKTSELNTSNDYYEAGYTEDSKVTEYNYQYEKNRNK